MKPLPKISLNNWKVTANGTETRLVNFYHFKNKTAFFVPYALCLGVAIPIAALGLASMHENDVTAITGGFLQVLMTTSDQFSLREAAQKYSIGGHENVSKELEEMEVRFGELITNEGYSLKETEVSSESNIAEDQTDSDEITAATFLEIEPLQEAAPRTEEIAASLHSSSSTKESAFVATSVIQDNVIRWRAGFGTMEETRPLRRV